MQPDKGRENMRPDMAVDQLMIKTNSMVNKCKQNQRKNMQKKVTCKRCNKGCQHMQTQGQCCNMRAWLTVLYRTMDDKLAHLRATEASVETHKQHMHKRIACTETSNATCAKTHQLHKKRHRKEMAGDMPSPSTSQTNAKTHMLEMCAKTKGRLHAVWICATD